MTDRPYSIIVVEDNAAVREALCEHLGAEGFEVRGVNDGESLTAAMALRSADALVLDLNLPLEDGRSIATRVRRACPGIGILILSGSALPSERVEGATPGAEMYLTKPVAPDALTAVLYALCCRLQPVPLAPTLVQAPVHQAHR